MRWIGCSKLSGQSTRALPQNSICTWEVNPSICTWEVNPGCILLSNGGLSEGGHQCQGLCRWAWSCSGQSSPGLLCIWPWACTAALFNMVSARDCLKQQELCPGLSPCLDSEAFYVCAPALARCMQGDMWEYACAGMHSCTQMRGSIT